MSLKLPHAFPSNAERLRRQVEAQRGWTASQRIAAVAESLHAVRALAAAAGKSEEQWEAHERAEEEGKRIMKEFLAKHARPGADQ